MKGNTKSHQDRERGQSLLEFAFMVVLLMILIAGIVDGARAVFTFMALRDAAQEGAAYGSTNPTDFSGIEARARQASTAVQDMGAEITVTQTVSPNNQYCMGSAITITIVYADFPLTTPFLGAIVGGQAVPITASITDTILKPPCGP